MSEPTTTPYTLPDDLRREIYRQYKSSEDGMAAVFLMGVRMALEHPADWRTLFGMDSDPRASVRMVVDGNVGYDAGQADELHSILDSGQFKPSRPPRSIEEVPDVWPNAARPEVDWRWSALIQGGYFGISGPSTLTMNETAVCAICGETITLAEGFSITIGIGLHHDHECKAAAHTDAPSVPTGGE